MEEVSRPVLGKEPGGGEPQPSLVDLQVSADSRPSLQGGTSQHLESEALEGEGVAEVPLMGRPVQSQPVEPPLPEGVPPMEAGPESGPPPWSDSRVLKPKPPRPDAKERLRREAERLRKLRDAARVVKCVHCRRHIKRFDNQLTGATYWKHSWSNSRQCTVASKESPSGTVTRKAEPE